MWKNSGKLVDAYNATKVRLESFEEFEHYSKAVWDVTRKLEEFVSDHLASVPVLGWENTTDELDVAGPNKFANNFNLRESIIDSQYMNNRVRLICLGVLSRVFGRYSENSRKINLALFEHETALHRALGQNGIDPETSRYTDESDPLFQDMQNLSYKSNRFDFLVHCDVLEHVPDAVSGLRECSRVLSDDGVLIFTAPFFQIPKNIVRAEVNSVGEITHHLEPEIHGDYLTDGVLAFYNFGWELIQMIKEAGFSKAYVEVCYNPYLGLFSNNCPHQASLNPKRPGNMLPLILVGEK